MLSLIFNYINNCINIYKYQAYLKYLPLVNEHARRLSKGRNTRVGAFILDSDRTILAQGYNGAPRGSRADLLSDERNVKPEKLYWISHAELNTITNAARVGVRTKGSIMVVNYVPCMECAKAIVQAGIVAVIAFKPNDKYQEAWGDSIRRTKLLFKECGVTLVLV